MTAKERHEQGIEDLNKLYEPLGLLYFENPSIVRFNEEYDLSTAGVRELTGTNIPIGYNLGWDPEHWDEE